MGYTGSPGNNASDSGMYAMYLEGDSAGGEPEGLAGEVEYSLQVVRLHLLLAHLVHLPHTGCHLQVNSV